MWQKSLQSGSCHFGRGIGSFVLWRPGAGICPGPEDCGSDSMKAYGMTTGTVFGLLTLAHI